MHLKGTSFLLLKLGMSEITSGHRITGKIKINRMNEEQWK